MKCKLLVYFALACPLLSFAQDRLSILNAYARKGKGVGVVTNDSLFSLNFQFRIQNRAAYVSKSDDDLAPETFEFRVRRLRMKFEGFVYNAKLTYYIQLSFSRGDMDWRNLDNSAANSSPNVVRDAVIYYSPTSKLRFGFGQTKLPGNRQRVVSSGDLQFADRSIVNAAYNMDRDFGFFAQYLSDYYTLRGAVTSGEGRNSLSSNGGLSYTGRVEVLPLGKFTDNNDYVEGDQEREPKPKVSIGVSMNYNDRAVREAGGLGNDLYDVRTLKTVSADVLFKFKGWAWYNEYIRRETSNPLTINPTDVTQVRAVAVGDGYLTQLSYLFSNNFEVAARYAVTTPSRELYDTPLFPSLAERKEEHTEFGVTKYLRGHRLKIQGNVVFGKRTDLRNDVNTEKFWSAIFQVEIGI